MIRTGDTILHRPSGEQWLVAYAEDGYVCCCGWPETLARIEDCELSEACPDDENEKLLRELAHTSRTDSRRSYAERELKRRAAMRSEGASA